MIHLPQANESRIFRRLVLLEEFGNGLLRQLPHHLVQVDGGEGPVLVEDFASDHGHGHVPALGGEHQASEYIVAGHQMGGGEIHQDRKSTRLNSSHLA